MTNMFNGCFYCEHRQPYDPDTDYCKLLDRKFENRLCMTVCRLKDCPLREEENVNGGTDIEETTQSSETEK